MEMAEQPKRNDETGGRTVSGRERGQIAVMFGLSMLAIIPLMGLIFDGGNIYVQRRTVQNAADAAALAGTHAMMKAVSPENPVAPDLTVADAVCKYLTMNSFGSDAQHTPTASAHFVDTSGTMLLPLVELLPANCSGTRSNSIPNAAAGVKVDATIGPFPTFVAGFLGKGLAGGQGAGIAQSIATASATVQASVVVAFDTSNAPFIICGVGTALSDSTLGTPDTESILITTSPAAIDPAFVGHTYLIHSGTSATPITNCGYIGFKGLADQVNNFGVKSLPTNLVATTGTAASSVQSRVEGEVGCNTTAALANGCRMLLPIAVPGKVNNIAPSMLSGFDCVIWAAFWITRPPLTVNIHYAQLLPGSSVGGGPQTFTWTFGTRNDPANGLTSMGLR
ncbi:MAG TPA: pilus assembly protein TadG-related protein [Chloroflexota bacterium]|nr:pilus assembly protein TadG-related protein [Chloroflexota bacterium]